MIMDYGMGWGWGFCWIWMILLWLVPILLMLAAIKTCSAVETNTRRFTTSGGG